MNYCTNILTSLKKMAYTKGELMRCLYGALFHGDSLCTGSRFFIGGNYELSKTETNRFSPI